MSAQLKNHSQHRGIQIYVAANTHPGSISTSLVVFTEDLPGKKIGLKRFRYRRCDGISHGEALTEARKFINNALNTQAPPQHI